MVNEKVKVKRKAIETCFTCHICKEMLKDATTISECLHTFCRNCIFRKFLDGNLRCCPVCSTDLGCVPKEKLRLFGESVEETSVDQEGPTLAQGGERDKDPLPKRQKTFGEYAKVIEIGPDAGWTGDKRRPIQVFEAFKLAQDDDYFSKMSYEECNFNVKCQMGKFMSFSVRMMAILNSEIKENSELLKRISQLEEEASRSIEKIECAHKPESNWEDLWKVEKKKMEDEKDGACEKLHSDLKKVKILLEDKEIVYNRVAVNLNEADITCKNLKHSLEESLQERDRLSAALEKMTEEKNKACASLNSITTEKDKLCSSLELLKQRNQLLLDLWAITN